MGLGRACRAFACQCPLSSPRPYPRPDRTAAAAAFAAGMRFVPGQFGWCDGFRGDTARRDDCRGARRNPSPATSKRREDRDRALCARPFGRASFETKIIATGPIVGGVVQGDLILKGGGDPLLDTDALGRMAEVLVDLGITGVTGAFGVDASAVPEIDLIDPGQPIQVGYNPAISGLNLNFNRVHFEWRRVGDQYDLTMDARAERYQPRVRGSRMRIANRSLPVYTHALGEGVEDWTVARSALGSGGARWLPGRRPAV